MFWSPAASASRLCCPWPNAEARDKPFTLHYWLWSASEAPLLTELKDICGRAGNVGSPEAVPASIRQRSARMTRTRTSTSAGRNGFWMPCNRLWRWPEDHVHGEVFQMTVDENFKPELFEATVASTGQRFLVPADKSLLDVLRDNDFAMPSSCEMGVCGSCECGYRDGLVLHRDKVLPTSKRQDRLMLCVSRARVSVTLDL